MRKLNIILAVDESGGFGKDGKIPWYYPQDLKHFQTITNGNICVMGRNTYQDIAEMRYSKSSGTDLVKQTSILPNRDCYVLSNTIKQLPDAHVSTSLHLISFNAPYNKEIFVIGGEKLFIHALTFTKKIYLTIVPGTYDCDRFFPIKVLNKWFKIESGEEKDGLTFMVYKR